MMENDYGDDPYVKKRLEMVSEQIEARGIKDPLVLDAMRRVPRHLFVPQSVRRRAYLDSALPLGEGQTISQPYMVAWMTELLGLEGGETVLEVGTGSGYQAAVLSLIAERVYSIERIQALASDAEERLDRLGYRNVEIVVADGTRGLPEHAPYRGIMVTAGSPGIPPLLVEQLADKGRLVIPVGSSSVQMLTLVARDGEEVRVHEKGSCVFVPLVGRFGWKNG